MIALRILSKYGVLVSLAVLSLFFSVATWKEQASSPAQAAGQVAAEVAASVGAAARVAIVTGPGPDDAAFADAVRAELENRGVKIVADSQGAPSAARETLAGFAHPTGQINAIVVSETAASWTFFDDLEKFTGLVGVQVYRPLSEQGSTFLKAQNLLNIANQISVIAVVAVGMTIVVIAGGIDLSVGSLIALAAVVGALLIESMGGLNAGVIEMTVACLAAIALCAALGAVSGVFVAYFGVPPFITTLAMMLVASGMAYIVAKGQSIYELPASFIWLGRGADVLGVPNAAFLVLGLYAFAHVALARTKQGRWLYAVGGNPEAARLAGVPVKRVLLTAYIVSGALAGLGGVVMASQLKSGSPTYGQMYELYVIAAVVVGGASLAGGQGTVLGTLVGALLIAVIRNGMNLTGVEAYTQNVILGLVILGSVLLDRFKR